ncbi:serologically defined colon cancer antigen 8 homolog isoform X3 [Tubulanus polymorphus]|uniref:serologically defined colon cancer antigen 8 homolog isoform X3 n=1 Tax=Tubulanus polymorphus TaxID=672921 RepID=UPI003DA305A3
MNALKEGLSRPMVKHSLEPQSPFRLGQHHRSWSDHGLNTANDYSYRSAVHKLRHMLKNAEEKDQDVVMSGSVQFSPPRVSQFPVMFDQKQPAQLFSHTKQHVPSIEEVLPVVHKQTHYIQQLESENLYYQEEMKELKMKLKQVTNENNGLLKELKHNAVYEIIHDSKEAPTNNSFLDNEEFRQVLVSPTFTEKQATMSRWKRELDRIECLHAAKNQRLEVQLSESKNEISNLTKQMESLKNELRLLESMGSGKPVSGICIRCAQNEALASSESETNSNIIRRLTRERDELIEQLAGLKLSLEQMKQREIEAYDQMKQSIILVEETQMEKMGTIVEKEQLEEEFYNMRNRLEKILSDTHRQVEDERETIRNEFLTEINLLNEKVKELNENHVICQSKLERAQRDKNEYRSEIQQIRQQIDEYGREYGLNSGCMKRTMATAVIERNKAVQDLEKYKIEIDRLNQDKCQYENILFQIRDKFMAETEDLRRRLNLAERELMDSKEQCIHLTSSSQSLEREMNFLKLSRETLEKSCEDDHQLIKQREQDLEALMHDLKNKHALISASSDDMVEKQKYLVQKLTKQCHSLTDKFESCKLRMKKEIEALASKNESIQRLNEKYKLRQKEFEIENIQHTELHEKMRVQLQQMDENANSMSQQASCKRLLTTSVHNMTISKKRNLGHQYARYVDPKGLPRI